MFPFEVTVKQRKPWPKTNKGMATMNISESQLQVNAGLIIE